VRAFISAGVSAYTNESYGTVAAETCVLAASSAGNGSGVFDGCIHDICFGFGRSGDLPIAADWTGTGTIRQRTLSFPR
jgi:hypothetical protein